VIGHCGQKPQKGRFEPENKLFSIFSVQIRISRAILPLYPELGL
jgi:hypothetical protein